MTHVSATNVFQRLTRQWDSLHPYNAGQAMKLAGRADRQLLVRSWQSTLSELGLGAAPQVEFLDTSLDQHMSQELNRRFDDLPAFRPFVIEHADGHYAGVVYHHWVADSFSIRLLLREWFLRMYEPQSARRVPLRTANRGYWRLFGPSQANWSLGGGVLQMFRWSARLRQARRVDAQGLADLNTHFSLHQAPDGLIQQIAAVARKHRVTVNDIFLAAMARVCDELVPVRRTPRRQNLALGTIVDLRSLSRQRLDDVFGLYLGFTSVICRPAELHDCQRLLDRIHQQNDAQKRDAAAQSSMLRMLTGLVAAKMLSRRHLLEFYRKRIALAGGISNVNLNRDWPAKYHPSPLLDYVRISPSGPMMPIVFTPTTLGQTLNFGLTCRTSVIDAQHAATIAQAFIARLREFV